MPLSCFGAPRALCFVQAENKNEAPQYDGTWRDADPAEVQAKIDAGVTYTYRFKVPKGKVRQVAHLRHTMLYCRGARDFFFSLDSVLGLLVEYIAWCDEATACAVDLGVCKSNHV